jgi:hypothetical protein
VRDREPRSIAAGRGDFQPLASRDEVQALNTLRPLR